MSLTVMRIFETSTAVEVDSHQLFTHCLNIINAYGHISVLFDNVKISHLNSLHKI